MGKHTLPSREHQLLSYFLKSGSAMNLGLFMIVVPFITFVDAMPNMQKTQGICGKRYFEDYYSSRTFHIVGKHSDFGWFSLLRRDCHWHALDSHGSPLLQRLEHKRHRSNCYG